MKTLNPEVARVLKRLHYPLDVILTCVRWYVSYALSLRNLEEMMAERTDLTVAPGRLGFGQRNCLHWSECYSAKYQGGRRSFVMLTTICCRGGSVKIHQLQALVASAETGSIRAAARSLGISQAAVTRALRELEGTEQLPLLIRAPAGISFTEYGKALLTHARLVLNQLEHAQNDLARLRGRAEGKLSVGVTPWITLTFLAETVLLFRERMPDIQLELFESLMAVAQPLLRAGDMDFVIGQLHPSTATQEFSCEPVLNYETAVMFAEDMRVSTVVRFMICWIRTGR